MPLRLGPLIPSKNIRILPVLNRNQIHQKAHKTLSLVLLYPGNASQENPNSFLLKSRSCPMSNGFYFCPHNLLKCQELFYYRRVCSRKFHFPVPPSKASFPLLAFEKRQTLRKLKKQKNEYIHSSTSLIMFYLSEQIP